jgi:hypothetical protein
MAVMRFPARLPVLLAAMLVLALPAVAAADIKPIPKPEEAKTTPAKPPAKPPADKTPASTPAVKPVTPPVQAETPPADTTPPADPNLGEETQAPAKPEKIVVLTLEGGRDDSGVPAVVIPPPDPTPLALVAASETLPSSSDGSTPAWKLALLALLAAAEAFLVVRLVRHRPGTLSPAQ